MGEGKKATLAHLSHHVSPKAGRKPQRNTWEVHIQRHSSKTEPYITGLWSTPLPSHLTTTWLKAYFLQFLLPGASCLAIKKKKKQLQSIPKGPKHNLNTKQISESDMVGMLDYQTRNFKEFSVEGRWRASRLLWKSVTDGVGPKR